MKRPGGVTLLAIVNLLEAFLLVFLAAMFWLLEWLIRQGAFPDASADMPASSRELLGALMRVEQAGWLGLLVVLLGILAVVFLALGVGLWKLRNWGRLGTAILAGVRLPLVVAGLAYSLAQSDPLGAGLQFLMLFVYGWIVWYLVRPDVKRAFGA